MGAVAVPVPVAADAAVSITIQLRKLTKPERMGVERGGNMMPMTFLRAGETGMIQRVGGAEDTKRFLANLGFVDGAAVTVISELNGNLIVNIKDSRVAINKEMAKHVMVQ